MILTRNLQALGENSVSGTFFSHHKPHTDMRGFELRPPRWLDVGYRSPQTRCQILLITCPQCWMSEEVLGHSQSSFQPLAVSSTAKCQIGQEPWFWPRRYLLGRSEETQANPKPFTFKIWVSHDGKKKQQDGGYLILVCVYRRFGEFFSEVIHPVMNIMTIKHQRNTVDTDLHQAVVSLPGCVPENVGVNEKDVRRKWCSHHK